MLVVIKFTANFVLKHFCSPYFFKTLCTFFTDGTKKAGQTALQHAAEGPRNPFLNADVFVVPMLFQRRLLVEMMNHAAILLSQKREHVTRLTVPQL